jgi:hypothetical protein
MVTINEIEALVTGMAVMVAARIGEIWHVWAGFSIAVLCITLVHSIRRWHEQAAL